MCGICGELRTGEVADVGAVARMNATMGDRGPDGGGVWSQGPVALGHRRLKIIDLSECAAQPMTDPELGLTIVFNGCIYNYPELREELGREGYRFFSTSDTEVLLKAYHRWGEGFVERLKGMFAFCIVERDSGRAILGRDRLGIKPLYLADTSGALRFASTLPADRGRRRGHLHRPRRATPLHDVPRRRADTVHDPEGRKKAGPGDAPDR